MPTRLADICNQKLSDILCQLRQIFLIYFLYVIWFLYSIQYTHIFHLCYFFLLTSSRINSSRNSFLYGS